MKRLLKISIVDCHKTTFLDLPGSATTACTVQVRLATLQPCDVNFSENVNQK